MSNPYTKRRASETTYADGRPFDLASYRRGWATGLYEARHPERYDMSREWTTPLERADYRGEPDEWYDGYSDQSQDNPKYHYRDCPVCGTFGGARGCPIGVC